MNPESPSPEHRDFYRRFQSFWAAPKGPRVAEVIAPNAKVHFTGVGTIDGKHRRWYGVDRFRIENGMAVEQHVIFDSAALRDSA